MQLVVEPLFSLYPIRSLLDKGLLRRLLWTS